MRKIFIVTRKIKEFLLDLIFPIECLGCGSEGIWLCKRCLLEISKLTQPIYPVSREYTIRQNGDELGFSASRGNKYPTNTIDVSLWCGVCPICRKIGKICKKCHSQTFLEGLLAVGSYQDELLRNLIHTFKYRFIRDLAEPLGILLSQLVKKNKEKKGKIIIVPVPLHKKRFLERGFNQAELLAQVVAGNLGLSFDSSLLIRHRYTLPQVTLNAKLRRENIKGAFRVLKPEFVFGRKIILVDDVITTGGTLEECAKVLRAAGAKEVWGLVLARGG